MILPYFSFVFGVLEIFGGFSLRGVECDSGELFLGRDFDKKLICLQSNPENTVGVLTMAGKGVRVLVTPTSDLGKILACMHGMLVYLLLFLVQFIYHSRFSTTFACNRCPCLYDRGCEPLSPRLESRASLPTLSTSLVNLSPSQRVA